MMNGKPAEFVVVGTSRGASGRFIVMGRNGDAPVHVGDTFHSLFRYPPRDERCGCGEAPRIEERAVSLRVVGVEAYGESLDAMGEGMTGSLTLEGEGVKHIAPGLLLGQDVNGSHVCAPESSGN